MKKTRLILISLFCSFLLLSACADKAVEYTALSEEIVVPEDIAIPDAATTVEKIINNEDIIEMPQMDDIEADENEAVKSETSNVNDTDSTSQSRDSDDEASGTTENNAKESSTDIEDSDISSQDDKDYALNDVNIYYVFGNFDEFKTEVAKIEGDITAEELIAQLAFHNVVPVDLKVNSFEIIQNENGAPIIMLDVSSSFESYISTMSREAEIALASCITNTFTEAFCADGLHLSVDGHDVLSQNLDYSGDLLSTVEPEDFMTIQKQNSDSDSN